MLRWRPWNLLRRLQCSGNDVAKHQAYVLELFEGTNDSNQQVCKGAFDAEATAFE